MDRTEKKELIDELNGVFQRTAVVVVAHYSGLTVAQLQRLRKQMREAGATVQVTKNRLTKIALEGTDVASIGSLLTGPTILAYSDDPVAAPKVVPREAASSTAASVSASACPKSNGPQDMTQSM